MSNILLAPGAVSVRFALDPVYNNLASLYLLALVAPPPRVDEWVRRTAASLPVERMRRHRVLFDLLYSAFEPEEDWPSFPAYLDHLGEHDPKRMRDRFLRHMFPDAGEQYARRNQLMDLQTFITQIDRGEFDQEIEHDLFAEAHALLSDPPAMRDAIVSHLRTMWHEVLAAEWERNEPFLRQIMSASESRDYAGLSAYEAIRAVTGRDAHGNWREMLAATETLIFIPSPHIGPYLMHYAYVPVVRMLFDAHLPEQDRPRPAGLSRADLLVQLRALSDETRLRILELLLEEGEREEGGNELCAQEIIARLKLTRSSASRHLSQLSATGYLTERQGAGKTKCYALNPERFQETIRALERYAQAWGEENHRCADD
jgi:DNA-binding transcriptional ArsR family regulator